MRIIFILTLLLSTLFSSEHYTNKQIKNMIAKMVIIGFDGTKISSSSKIYQDIQKYNLGGVILFDKNLKNKSIKKNIINPSLLKELTSSLQSIRDEKLLIAIDQEGGVVQRLKKSNGFISTPSAKQIASEDKEFAKQAYSNLAIQLKNNGINVNFAPVVDLSINSKNKVIYKLNRSYSNKPDIVVKFASIFLEELNKENIISVVKHFPGHGSSYGDSHQGFVDITNTWQEKELEPYKKLIKNDSLNMVMTAHVYNKNLDDKYPATLSYKINTKLLRETLDYKGLIVSDDLQMKAISKHYNLKQTVKLAINAGVNILLFGNQLGEIKLETIINSVFKQIKKGEIPLGAIVKSNKKIANLLQKL
ncbi:MAG: glycoside hydrolase family 3 N-terminal domain-containing protein [Campylobacterota bacterium]